MQQLLAMLGELHAEDVDERGAVRFVLRSLARRGSQNGLSPQVRGLAVGDMQTSMDTCGCLLCGRTACGLSSGPCSAAQSGAEAAALTEILWDIDHGRPT